MDIFSYLGNLALKQNTCRTAHVVCQLMIERRRLFQKRVELVNKRFVLVHGIANRPNVRTQNFTGQERVPEKREAESTEHKTIDAPKTHLNFRFESTSPCGSTVMYSNRAFNTDGCVKLNFGGGSKGGKKKKKKKRKVNKKQIDNNDNIVIQIQQTLVL
jgi:hypothetical protein